VLLLMLSSLQIPKKIMVKWIRQFDNKIEGRIAPNDLFSRSNTSLHHSNISLDLSDEDSMDDREATTFSNAGPCYSNISLNLSDEDSIDDREATTFSNAGLRYSNISLDLSEEPSQQHSLQPISSSNFSNSDIPDNFGTVVDNFLDTEENLFDQEEHIPVSNDTISPISKRDKKGCH
ncbi:MAG: hypothetical protein ACRDFB_08895, partial [Rhabdochlamydiaceae bacterium]